jgi:hypothetical protein
MSNIFWNVTPCSVVKVYRRFGRTYCQTSNQTEARRIISELLWRNTSQKATGSTLHSHRTENLTHDKQNRCFLRNVNDNKKFWEELIAYFLLIRHWWHSKRSRCIATISGLVPSPCLATVRGDKHTDGQQRDLISLLYFHFQNRKVG